jgi:hypothetical protein
MVIRWNRRVLAFVHLNTSFEIYTRIGLRFAIGGLLGRRSAEYEGQFEGQNSA